MKEIKEIKNVLLSDVCLCVGGKGLSYHRIEEKMYKRNNSLALLVAKVKI